MVEWEFFGGRLLNSGWSFVSMNYSGARCAPTSGLPVPDRGFEVLKMPQVGSRDIKYKVRLWTAPGTTCEFIIYSITIRGPSNAAVGDAFK
jgi:hypothetical protein